MGDVEYTEVENMEMEMDVFLSSTDDNDVFEFNNGNLFCNTLKDYLRFYVDKDIFVKFESVVVKGVKAKSFLICLNGVPYDRTVRYNSLPDEDLSTDHSRQVIKACIPVDDGDGENCLDGVRRFGFNDECYPFRLNTNDVWSVELHEWSDGLYKPYHKIQRNSMDHSMIPCCEDCREMSCFIHLKIMTSPSCEVKNIIRFPSNFNASNAGEGSICNMGMYPSIDVGDDGDVDDVLQSRWLYTQVDVGEFVEGIELFGGKMVRVDGGVIKNVSNIKEPNNWLKIHIKPQLQIKPGDFYDYIEEREKGFDIGRDITIEIPEGWYSSIEDLVRVMNIKLKNAFKGYMGGVDPFIEFTVKNGKVIMKSLLYHEITVEMDINFSNAIGFPHAFRLIGGGVPEMYRSNIFGYRARLKEKMVGYEPYLKKFPTYFLIRSNIGSARVNGLPGVICVAKCVGDVENGCLAFKSCGDSKYSTMDGQYMRVECELYDVCNYERDLIREFNGCSLGVQMFIE